MAITVSNTTELYSALRACKGGETILLEGGQYGELGLNPYMKPATTIDFPSTVTIASADPANPAVFSKADVRDASNIAFEGITFDYTFKPGDPQNLTPFAFSGCDGLTIRDCTFDGDVASGVSASSDGYATAVGLFVRGCTDTVVEGNEAFGFWKGMNFYDNADTTVRDNDLHSMRMDGMVFTAMDGVLIEDNYVHDFRGSPTAGDHCDMIQFYTTGTTEPSKDVVIRDNVLDIGQGTFTQSIFMRNEVVDSGRASFADMAYRNVTIENNTIINAHQWGISVGEAVGLSIHKNTVVHSDGGSPDGGDANVEVPLINVASNSTDVSITQNVTASIAGHSNQASWSVANNTFVQDQDPLKAGYYGDVFVQSSLQAGEDGRHEYVALEGSAIDRSNTGSMITQPEGQGLRIIFHVEEADEATRIFDAGPSRLDGVDLPAGTNYRWSFGDGTTASGERVSHSYTGGGDYAVTLTVTLPDQGPRATETAVIPVESPELVTMDATGRFTAYEQGEAIALGAGKTASGDGLQLGAAGVSATVDRAHVVDVVSSDNMTIAFTLDADKVGSSGELFRLHGSFVASVTTSGELQVQIMRDGTSTINLTTKGAGLNATLDQDHDVVVSLEDGQLQAWVNGKLGAQVSVSGVVGGATGFGTHDLVFGNPWDRGNFSGDLSGFELSVGAGDFPAAPRTTVLDPSARTLSDTQADEPAAEMTALMGPEDGHEAPAADVDTLQADEAPQGDALDGSHDRFATLLDEPLDAYAA